MNRLPIFGNMLPNCMTRICMWNMMVVCRTKCCALLRSARHLSDLQEVTLKVCLPNKKSWTKVHIREWNDLGIGDHMIRCYMQEMRRDLGWVFVNNMTHVSDTNKLDGICNYGVWKIKMRLFIENKNHGTQCV